MKTINEITDENFKSSFNLKDILEGSTFYPASGIDGTAIECLSGKTNSFVHVDYSRSFTDIENALENDFQHVGYRLIGNGPKSVSKEELTPNGFRPRNFTMNEHERQRMEKDFIKERFQCRNFTPFALWAVYELDETTHENTDGKIQRFSLLHIGGEACATFEAIYLNNKINPFAVAIINPGEGFGDNWTVFRDPDFRLFKSIVDNHEQNGASMPEYLCTNFTMDDECFWPGYSISERLPNQGCRIFTRNI